MSAEPQPVYNFQKLNTMPFRAFALASTILKGTKYYVAAGFGDDDFYSTDPTVAADLSAFLCLHIVIVPEDCFVTRLMQMRARAASGELELMHSVFGHQKLLYEHVERLSCPEHTDSSVVRACLGYLRKSPTSRSNPLANFVAFKHDPSDTPIDLKGPDFIARLTADTAEAAANMQLLPDKEVKYTLLPEIGAVRLEFGALLGVPEVASVS